MIDISALHALAHTALGTFAAKPTSIEGEQQETSLSRWTSPDKRVAIGGWECTVGRFTADRSKASEFCHLISGRIEMTHADGSKVRLWLGDAINLRSDGPANGGCWSRRASSTSSPRVETPGRQGRARPASRPPGGFQK